MYPFDADGEGLLLVGNAPPVRERAPLNGSWFLQDCAAPCSATQGVDSAAVTGQLAASGGLRSPVGGWDINREALAYMRTDAGQ